MNTYIKHVSYQLADNSIKIYEYVVEYPKKYRKSDDPHIIEEAKRMNSLGIKKVVICKNLDISMPTLRKILCSNINQC